MTSVSEFAAVEQRLSSDTLIRQDFRKSVRFVMFETTEPAWVYATHGGTAFIVNYRSKYFGITCGHVRGDFSWNRLVLTSERFGQTVCGISAGFYPSTPIGYAEESDILDVAVASLSDDVDATLLNDTPYIIDPGTIFTANTATAY